MATVYIVDDEVQTANMLGQFVKLMGFNAKVYTQALLFLSENASFPEDAVLILDLNMPYMDGVEVMRQLAKRHDSIPLILISGYDNGVLHSAERLAQAHSMNLLATLAKPLQFKTLKSIIQKHFKSYKAKFKTSYRKRVELSLDELKTAIQSGWLELHYQPQVDIKSGVFQSVEALVRMNHPEYGLIYPDSFISLAEQNGLIGMLTEQVIKQAVEQTSRWKSIGLSLQVSVNVSAENITSLSLPEQLSEMLKTKQLDPSLLTIEVTESALMGELVTSLDILTRLRMKGIELSIDDFGTGHSSMAQLYSAPFTELKVDQVFVMNMKKDEEAYGIVKTCIMLAHELKMQVVAEGVEDNETLNLLKGMGCDIAQGYYIAKPMSAKDIIDWNQDRYLSH